MYFKVRITKGLPQAKTGGFTGNNLNKQVISFGGADMNAASRHLENTRYLKKVPRDEANLEAEGGETAFGDINGDGFTEHMIISGKRHHEGGVPLNLPDGTFIFSDTASMKITDCNILKMFGKKCGTKGYTPAELAKPYDLNKYRKILEDPNSDKIDKKSAELMIKNINLKLGALALAQEAKKGFPQGIPEVARPYMEEMGIREEDLMPQKAQPEAQVNQQAMQNPYEAQGMQMQSPEEEMMEQGPGMQNPQEEMMEAPMAQYGMSMGGYGMPFHDTQYRTGGTLTRYQKKGEVDEEEDDDKTTVCTKNGCFKVKKYTKDDLPADAVVRDRITVDAQPGDFIKQENGSYYKVTKASLVGNPTSDSKSSKMTIEEFKKESPENAKLIDDANAIIKRGIDNKTIKTDGKGNIQITNQWSPTELERILVSRALNVSNAEGKKFGTDKYTITSQQATGPYSKLVNGKIKGTGSFVAGFTPDLYERRFIFEQAKGLGLSDEEALAEVDRIQKDDKTKAQLRRQFLTTLGVKDIPKEDKDLLSEDFYKKRYSDVTSGIESTLAASNYRPGIGNEGLSGLEHYDAFGFKPGFDYETEAKKANDKADTTSTDITDEESDYQPPYNVPPAAWKQDKLNLANAAVDYLGRKKYLPFAMPYAPQLQNIIYADPTKELSNLQGQTYTNNNALAQFLGANELSARQSSNFGQMAAQAANVMNRYNAGNVDRTNALTGRNTDIMNEAQRYNQGLTKQLYDQNVVANQNYDNTERAFRHNLVDAENTLTTNKWKTDALNQLYPQYAVDPRSGGRMYFTQGRKARPTSEMDDIQYAEMINNKHFAPEVQAQLIKGRNSRASQNQFGVDPNIMGLMYGSNKKGGSLDAAYVMGSNVFPFMFY